LQILARDVDRGGGSLTQLRTLDVSNTSVTDAGVNELKKVLPNVRITR
jgi:hypothetical protein